MTQALVDAIFNGNSLTLVFVIGGFLWLAKNHLAHIQTSLEELRHDLNEVREEVSFIRGRCIIHTREDED